MYLQLERSIRLKSGTAVHVPEHSSALYSTTVSDAGPGIFRFVSVLDIYWGIYMSTPKTSHVPLAPENK